MKYYKTGEFAKMANVSIRTIRYYDNVGLLKPSKIADNGYRIYTDKDFIKLQKILSLKYLGFSLDYIFSMTVNDNHISLQQSLSLQKKMIDQKIDYLQNIKESLEKTENYVYNNQDIDWQEILNSINFSTMEKELINQYKNSTNIDIRIKLHERYSKNPNHWFEWVYDQYEIKSNMKVLEIGCGNGQIWLKNKSRIPNLDLTLSDISQGMLEDAKINLKGIPKIQYQCFDCHYIPFEDESFDVVIANHVLFYLQDLDQCLSEIKRVLKKKGLFYCSTYGRKHMKEITDLTKEFDPKITLSDVTLYNIFGLENGYQLLRKYFQCTDLKCHKDYLLVDNADDIINYILSCHGNQSEYVLKDYEKFRGYMYRKLKTPLRVTKDAGMFICQK